MQLANYLFFNAVCEQALNFYTRCGLGRVTELMRYGVDGAPIASEAMRGKIMHARFEGPGVLFFASDHHEAEPMRGSAYILFLNDLASADRMFARLSEGGVVTAPLAVQPWGDYFSKFRDRFGVHWMLECPAR